MEIYSALFNSMVVDCLEPMGIRRGLVYTSAMMALGLGFCLNLVSAMDLLWALGLLNDPYRSAGALHPQHYVYGLLYGGFVANTVLARIKFTRDCQCLHQMPDALNLPMAAPHSTFLRRPGPGYVLGSGVLFLATTILNLLIRA